MSLIHIIFLAANKDELLEMVTAGAEKIINTNDECVPSNISLARFTGRIVFSFCAQLTCSRHAQLSFPFCPPSARSL